MTVLPASGSDALVVTVVRHRQQHDVGRSDRFLVGRAPGAPRALDFCQPRGHLRGDRQGLLGDPGAEHHVVAVAGEAVSQALALRAGATDHGHGVAR
jgi:hypothetical protein